jgi:hypothetical protein
VTIVLICILVAVALAIVGAYLLVSGRREERAELAAGSAPDSMAPDPAVPRVRLRPHAEAEPAEARPRPQPEVSAPMPVAARPADGAVRAAGRARLEAALERARARLADERDAAERPPHRTRHRPRAR